MWYSSNSTVFELKRSSNVEAYEYVRTVEKYTVNCGGIEYTDNTKYSTQKKMTSHNHSYVTVILKTTGMQLVIVFTATVNIFGF